MTVSEAIAQADAIAPNHYTPEQKLRWLSDLDGKITHEVLLTHEQRPFDQGFPCEGHDDASEELIVQAPYATDVYVNYLLSRVAEANAEVGKYNLYSALFNSAYQDFTNRYNRTHTPKGEGEWRY